MTLPTRRTARLAPLTLASLLVLAQLGALVALAPAAGAQVVAINTISPGEGTTNGGTQVTLTGTGFQAGALVEVEGVPATGIEATTTQVKFFTPAHADPGAVAIKVTNPNGASTTFNGGFTYTAASAPTITSLSPAAGTSNGGTVFTITGTNFAPGVTVTLGGVSATVLTVTSTTITAVSVGKVAGTVDVVVANPDTKSDTEVGAWTYSTASAPTVTSLSPASGTLNGGTVVTVTGTNFAPGAIVTFEGVAAPSTVFVSSTQLQAVSPASDSGPDDVRVTNPNTQQSTEGSQFFNFLAVGSSAAPTVTSIAPKNGTVSGGTPFTLIGTNFHTGSNVFPTVTFGGTPATDLTVVSATELRGITPAHAFGAVDVVVDNNAGVADANTDVTKVGFFTYVPTTTFTKPTLTSVTPAGAVTTNGGVLLDIDGAGFMFANGLPTVTVGGIGATVCTDDDLPVDGCFEPTSEQLTVLAPARTSNTAAPNQKIKVTNADGRFTESDNTNDNGDEIDYLAVGDVEKTPTVTLLAPTSSADTNGGDVVTITGTNFAVGGFPSIVPTVTFGTAPAVVCTGVANAPVAGCPGYAPAAEAIRVIAPGSPSASSGAKDVKVTNPNGIQSTTTASPDFTYTSKADAPTVSAATIAAPTTTLGGGLITVTGSDFAQGLAEPQVVIGGVTVPASDIAVAGGGASLTAKAPAHAAGVVNVVITNPDGQAVTLASGDSDVVYTAGNAPDIGSIDPQTGFVAGGGLVTIQGSNFPLSSGAMPTVTVGGTALPAANILSINGAGTEIVVKLPSRTSPGVVTFTVANPDGQAASLGGAFRYLPAPPTLNSVTPTSGTANGGTELTLTGTFSTFLSGTPTSVIFIDGLDEFPGTVTSVTTSTIKVLTPPMMTTPGGSLADVDIRVIDLFGQAALLADAFDFNAALEPTFTSVSPALASLNGGATITVTGNGFGNVQSVTVGGAEATGVTTASATSLTFVMPNFAHPDGLMTLGPIDVVITNGDGQMLTLLNKLAYSSSPGPVINSVSPTSGAATGGTALTIKGANFASGATVTVGGKACTSVAVVNATTITCTTPAGNGTVAVNVTIGGQTVSLPAAFTYSASTASSSSTSSSSSASTSTSSASSSSSSTVTTGPGGITAAEIQDANEDVDVDVDRVGDDNLVKFDLPTNLPGDPAGVQIWRSNSPFVLVKTLDDSEADFIDGDFLDVGAPADSRYLVTIYYGLSAALGYSSTGSSAQVPGFDSLGNGVSSADGNGVPVWVWILLAVLVVVIILVIIILVARRRNAAEARGGDEGYAWDEEEGATAGAAAGSGQGEPKPTHQCRCPSCNTQFAVTGIKPITTTCPGCGRKGILR